LSYWGINLEEDRGFEPRRPYELTIFKIASGTQSLSD